MSARKKQLYLILALALIPHIAFSSVFSLAKTPSLARTSLAKQLGWMVDADSPCGGYYLEAPFDYAIEKEKDNSVQVTSQQGLVSQRGTSNLEGEVTISRQGQQMTANKAFLYRNPTTGRLSVVNMIGDVHLREPNTLIVAKEGKYYFATGKKSLFKIFYRTSIYGKHIIGPKVTTTEIQKARRVTAETAWGKAYEFSQSEPQVYELQQASYSTCPPLHPAWRMKASHIVLNKKTGRGYATNARLLVKNVPVIYIPYINFPLDSRRKTGFLWPMIGASNSSGPSFFTPFYWNMASNYDMTVTPGFLMKRGVQLTDNFRYLSDTSRGSVYLSVLPSDNAFAHFQTNAKSNTQFIFPNNNKLQPANVTNAELKRLLNSSTTRKSFVLRDESQFNDHWSSHIDFNYAGDDYYLRDLGTNLNEYSTNQLLQEADLYYKSENWNFTGRLQTYQTLHPIDAPLVQNQYRRFPQLILNGDYPNQLFGLEYFVNSEITHFDIRNTPGTLANLPIGNRLHLQPGVSLPIYAPSYFINPRVQFALTDYNLYQTTPTATPNVHHRALPIVDVASGLAYSRDMSLFRHGFEQTLEPQVYYTYIPYRNQSSIPVFDTTTNTLYYDQLFNYNRFTNIDRIGDANQVSVGVATRLIDRESGLQKVFFGVGDIVYFENRKVTLCNSKAVCTDYPGNPDNHRRLSSISSTLTYAVHPYWTAGAYNLWNPITKQLDNSSLSLHFQPGANRIVNLGFSYARGGDILSSIETPSPSDNLKVTDVSISWPLTETVTTLMRYSQNWNRRHLQNLLIGLQYDTCCFAIRLVGAKTYLPPNPTNNNKLAYRNEFYIQFSLKGLGNVGRDPTDVLARSIAGYSSQFGQEV